MPTDARCPMSIHCFLGAGHEGPCRDHAMTADGWALDSEHLRQVVRDSGVIFLLRCPGCAVWGEIDDDQLHGRISLHHDEADGGCGYHETHDFWGQHAAR